MMLMFIVVKTHIWSIVIGSDNLRFVCNQCGFEMDYDENQTDIIECEECNGIMYADEDE